MNSYLDKLLFSNKTKLLKKRSQLKGIDSKYDIVLANINRNILLHDMPKFKLAMVPNATLILSGFYMQDEDLLINKAKELNIKETRRYTKNNWCMLEFINADN